MTNQNATISLLCPTRGRAAQAMRLALSVVQTASQPERIELLFYVDSNDPEKVTYEKALQQHKSQLDRLRRCLVVVAEPIGISKAWNILAAVSQGSLLVMAADDQTYNTTGWDDRLLAEIQRFPDEIFCMWFNEGHWGENLCTFPIVSRKWCVTLGYFTTGLFECLYDDLWIMDLAQRLDRLHYIPDVLTEHLHWSYGKSEIDETYAWKQVNNEGQLKPAVRRDMNLFSRTASYREADALRLVQHMDNPPQALKSGLALMGETSIFSNKPIAQSVQIETILHPIAVPVSPVLVNLCLPQSDIHFKLQLRPQIPQQQEMLATFRQGQYYQPDATQLLMQVLQPGDCFIDASAGIGYLAALAALIVGDRGQVLALESEADRYGELLETIRLNAFRNLRASQVALGSPTLPSLDRLLMVEPRPTLIKLNDPAFLTLRNSRNALRDRPVPYLLCLVAQQTAIATQAFQGAMAEVGYDAFLLKDKALHPLEASASQTSDYGILEGCSILLRRKSV